MKAEDPHAYDPNPDNERPADVDCGRRSDRERRRARQRRQARRRNAQRHAQSSAAQLGARQMKTLSEAISAAQAAIAALETADAKQSNAQRMFEAATANKSEADAADMAAIAAFNTSMEDLAAAALAAKVDRVPQGAPPATGAVTTLQEPAA